MHPDRRDWLRLTAAGALLPTAALAQPAGRKPTPLRITGLKVTPIALPDPPLLAASGCHGPYFLRNIVELTTDQGITGIAETRGGERVTQALEQCAALVKGQNVFAYRALFKPLYALHVAAWTAIEIACLDAGGQATGRRLCELLGGPVREEVEFAAYLFYRYAADEPKLLADRRIADGRGKGDRALDDWGEVRTPAAMVKMAARFQAQWGFRIFKLKAGVLPPATEWETMQVLQTHFAGKQPLRIDPNARWTKATALAIGKKLKDVNLEYYEDPVAGQQAMSEVRAESGLPMSTNMCVTRFEHVPEAVRLKPVDVVLADLHYWGGFTGNLELGRLCETFGWRVSQHSNNHAGLTMAAMIHLGATMPQLTVASDTHYPWLVESGDVIAGPKLPIRGGKMAVPTGPGLGVRLDPAKVAQAHETYRKCGMRDRDDATTMRLVEPAWERRLY